MTPLDLDLRAIGIDNVGQRQGTRNGDGRAAPPCRGVPPLPSLALLHQLAIAGVGGRLVAMAPAGGDRNESGWTETGGAATRGGCAPAGDARPTYVGIGQQDETNEAQSTSAPLSSRGRFPFAGQSRFPGARRRMRGQQSRRAVQRDSASHDRNTA